MTAEPWVPIVIYDACVLYPNALRNLLVQCAVFGQAHAHWTDRIQDEWMLALAQNGPGRSPDRLRTVRDRMNLVLPAATVERYEARIPGISLPDPDDRHVVAAAIEIGATAIVSADRHFRPGVLRPYGVEIWTPNTFLMKLYRADIELTISSLRQARRNLTRSQPDAEAFIAALRRCGNLDEFCGTIEAHAADL